MKWLVGLPSVPLDFPADVLGDLKTTGDELSVYEVTDTISPERIAIALAATKNKPDQTAYAVFDHTAVERLGIATSAEVPGNTPDAAVNALHRDLRIGTVRRLLDVAAVIASADIVPILKNTVVGLLKDGFESGRQPVAAAAKSCTPAFNGRASPAALRTSQGVRTSGSRCGGRDRVPDRT